MFDDQLPKAIEVMRQGGIVIYPTDTAFGIGCRIDNHSAVERLFSIRKKPPFMPMPVLVTDILMAKKYFKMPIPQRAEKDIKKFWPGGLTVVYYYSNNKNISSLISGSTTTIGMRAPDHKCPLKIIEAVGKPIVGTSANFHGKFTPFRTQDIDPGLIKLVDYVVEGTCKRQNISTVVDYTFDPPKILRQGVVRI